MLRVDLELLAQPTDMDIDGPLVAVTILVPDAIQQLASSEGPTGVARQEVEQPELLGSQVRLAAVAAQFARLEVELDAIRDAQPMAIAWLARLLRQERQAAAQLVGIEVQGQRRVEAEPQGVEALVNAVSAVQEGHA